MTTVEEIMVRLGAPVSRQLVTEIEQTFSNIPQPQTVRIFVDTETRCDLLVQIWTNESRRSKAGLELASHLKTLGIVNHVVWETMQGYDHDSISRREQ